MKSANIQIKQIVFLYEFLEEDQEIEDRLDKLLALIKNSEKEKSKRKGEEVKVLGEGIGGEEEEEEEEKEEGFEPPDDDDD